MFPKIRGETSPRIFVRARGAPAAYAGNEEPLVLDRGRGKEGRETQQALPVEMPCPPLTVNGANPHPTITIGAAWHICVALAVTTIETALNCNRRVSA